MTNEEAIKIWLPIISDGVKTMPELKDALDMAIKALEQESQTFEWCTDCREYDQEKHCCHRWSKVIRNTVEGMKQTCEDARWVPVSEEYPTENGRYLVTVKQGYITFGAWVGVAENWAQVTAWMPLLEPYEAESEGTDADNN